MSLNYKAIEQAVNEETDTGGFPQLIRVFKALNVNKYEYFVAEGLYRYHDAHSFVDMKMNGVPKIVEKETSFNGITEAVKQAQAGVINFEQFCELAGKSGISYWVSDLEAMTIAYCDLFGTIILTEPIPEAESN
ncbi:DUF1398 domain-containing protein [Enterococcus sp. BWT-B8]|uniref:DUF1398 family protein n=1 Tax=unclassified Enterococcus TaxID=2608891 RepID=UPI001E38FE26|nr:MULTISPECIES: DUF1398 family protein [unclassified Enterococcus]MCB5952299.1 DUF1398 domain-containing protein [Enterococcus sp. BWT-B8]MCB5955472.1 DUF1398 domain-containing protein [Enterococcus sp. CWB-B31]